MVPRFRVCTSSCVCFGLVGCLRYSMSLKSAQYVIVAPVNRLLTYKSIALNGFTILQDRRGIAALRAVCRGAPHGFRYRQRLLDIDFALRVFYVGPTYRVVYIEIVRTFPLRGAHHSGGKSTQILAATRKSNVWSLMQNRLNSTRDRQGTS